VGQSLSDCFDAGLWINGVDPDVIEEGIRGATHRAAQHKVAPERWRLGSPIAHAEKVAARWLARGGYLVTDPADSLLRHAVEVDLPVAVPAIGRRRRYPKLSVGVPVGIVRARRRIDNGIEIPDVASLSAAAPIVNGGIEILRVAPGGIIFHDVVLNRLPLAWPPRHRVVFHRHAPRRGILVPGPRSHWHGSRPEARPAVFADMSQVSAGYPGLIIDALAGQEHRAAIAFRHRIVKECRREIPTHGNRRVLDLQHALGALVGGKNLIHRRRRAGEPHPFDIPLVAVPLRVVDINRAAVLELVVKDQMETGRRVRAGVIGRGSDKSNRMAVGQARREIVYSQCARCADIILNAEGDTRLSTRIPGETDLSPLSRCSDSSGGQALREVTRGDE